MNDLQSLFQKVLTLFRIRPVLGGLDISDQVLRLVYFDGKVWQLHAVRLEQGVLENGHIKDREKFLAALAALKAESTIGGRSKNKRVSVVIALSSVNVYGQIFDLPPLGGEELAKAVELNLRMASPEDQSKIYASWQIAGKNESSLSLEVLSSFIEKDAVDGMIRALFEAGFFAVAVEPRSLALTRILCKKGSGIDIKKPYLLVNVDNAGIEFVVIRNGAPYFEYNNRWREVVDEKGEIAVSKFEAELTASLHQVLNFYGQHWADPVSAIIISATAFHDEIEKAVAAATSIPAVRLTLEIGQPISSEWLVGFGCSLRGLNEDRGRVDINLSGEECEGQFKKDQIIHFLQFWQVLMPVAFIILAAIFITADLFLGNVESSLEVASGFASGIAQTASVGAWQASSTAFNNQVAMFSALQASGGKTSSIFSDIVSKARASGVVISHLSLPGSGATIIFSGTAQSEDRILAFKNALSADPKISAVNLPLTGVQSNGGSYSFSMTFLYLP